MGTIFIIIVVAAVIYFLVKQIKKSRVNVGDDYFEQHGVRVNFKEGTISINKNIYNVNQVTGIKTITGGSVGTVKGVEIQVDDLKKPIHKIVIGGFGRAQENFAQRLSVALRKADGPSFV